MSQWHKHHDCCEDCGQTTYPHMAKGLCNRCYLSKYRNDERNRNRIAESKRQWYLDNHAECLQEHKEYREQRHFDGKRDQVIERDCGQCARCGITTQLVVHHRDRNGRNTDTPNNNDENLETCCRACRLREHHHELHAARTAKHATPKLNQSGRWSKQYNACVQCGLTTSRHAAKGLCNRCNVRRYKMT